MCGAAWWDGARVTSRRPKLDMERKLTKTIALMLGSMFSGFLIGAGTEMILKAPKTVPCTAGVNELCPNSDWMLDYNKMQAEQASIKDKLDVINGMTTRLRNGIPQGYNWDEQQKKFVKAAPQVVPPAK